ncbi:PhoX family protein [Thermomicrobium sp.]
MVRRAVLPLSPTLAAWLAKCQWACESKCFTKPVNPSENPTFENVLAPRSSRRSLLGGAAAVALVFPAGRHETTEAGQRGHLTFRPITLDTRDEVTVPEGYESRVIVRWGDPLQSWGPEFRFGEQSPEAQAQQFGYNCDFVGLFLLGGAASGSRGLLAVNHEYTNPKLMFPSYREGDPEAWQVAVELEAHGVTIVEVFQHGHGQWHDRPGSPFNRHITGTTRRELTGPAAGSDWLKTSTDSTGTVLDGTLNNCAGGKTLRGTLLTCEENFHQ